MTGWSLAYFLRLILRAFFFLLLSFSAFLHPPPFSVGVILTNAMCVRNAFSGLTIGLESLCDTGWFFLFYKVFLDSHKMKRWVYVMICVTAFKHRPSRNICFWPSVPPPPPKKSIKFMTTIQARLPNCLIGVVLNYCSSLFLCSVVSS